MQLHYGREANNDTNPSTTVESSGPEPKHTIIYKTEAYHLPESSPRPFDSVSSLVRFVETVQYSWRSCYSMAVKAFPPNPSEVRSLQTSS
ncbi:hypothetical protein FOVSG1_003637 [Fusarium oxysporum f. sp. vasinfectum]